MHKSVNELNTIELVVKIVNVMLGVSYHTHKKRNTYTFPFRADASIMAASKRNANTSCIKSG